ncbi:Oxysterol-binding protein OBPa [Nothophoma quercina]|uniref:Oxysterol-binding protein OBPa n=1 Tax=Nothophoma quercina TaxID=749835 RepID=A0ABR3RGC4_9PLEO
MAHPETLLPLPDIEDPVQRFVGVTKFYLSGWHIKPPGVKKPLNPILGEIFTGYWDYPDGTKGYYISEQTSHHPPKSSYFFMAPEHNIRVDGTLKPRSKFLGNSAASMMEGIAILRFANTGERFFITQPNIYVRGILFGTMKYELGDHAYVRCPETGMVADVEFKTKGYFSGGYNAIGGYIKDKNGKALFELSGSWNEDMYIKDLTTGKKELFFDASKTQHTPPKARPMEEQDERESQRLWHDVTEAVKRRDQETATTAKAKIEDRQREETAARNNDNIDWRPQLFRAVKGGSGGPEEGEEDLDWIINAKVSVPTTLFDTIATDSYSDGKTAEEQVKQILQIHSILPGQKPDKQFSIPQRTNSIQQAPAQQQENGASLEQQEQQRVLAQQGAQQQPPVQQHEQQPQLHAQPPQVQQQYAKEEPQVQQVQQQLASVDLNHSTPQAQANNGYEPIRFSPYQADSAYAPPAQTQPAQAQTQETNPPSKLLHSNPAPEPTRDDKLRRKDSETQEEDEFHDAHS